MSLLAAIAGSLAKAIQPISIAGTLSVSGVPAGGIASVASSTKTVTVPPGNSGSIKFANYSSSGTTTKQYSKNGGAFTTVAENTDVVFANSDTIRCRITGAEAGEYWGFSLIDNTTGDTIGSYTIEAIE